MKRSIVMRHGLPGALDSAMTCCHGAFPLRQICLAFVASVICVQADATWRWDRVGTSGGPGQRSYAVVAWTGKNLLVWGGRPFGIDTKWQNDGWRYDPGTDSWHAMSATNAPVARQFPVGVWTGRELVIWGGHKTTNPPDSLKTGACYDPATDTWRSTNTAGVPAKRGDHTMVWTGSKVIIWGGYDFDNGEYLSSGGCYDPDSNSWTSVSTLNNPAKRIGHTAVWTGSQMIIWGGGYLTSGLDWSHRSGFGAYDPVADQWTSGVTAGAPAARSDHSAVWTGSQMFIGGGWRGNTFEEQRLNTGGTLDFAAGTWTSLPVEGVPLARAGHCCVWTGREMIVWGGSVSGGFRQSGGRFDPSSAIWAAMPTDGAPSGGNRGGCAWTGEALYVLYDCLARTHETGPYSLDGIPDDWQYQYFGAQIPEGAADQDPDADGQDNMMEFLARTIPTDASSRLVFGISFLPASAELEFHVFPMWADRSYRLECSDLTPPVAWSPAGGIWTVMDDHHGWARIARPAFSRKFYRLALELR